MMNTPGDYEQKLEDLKRFRADWSFRTGEYVRIFLETIEGVAPGFIQRTQAARQQGWIDRLPQPDEFLRRLGLQGSDDEAAGTLLNRMRPEANRYRDRSILAEGPSALALGIYAALAKGVVTILLHPDDAPAAYAKIQEWGVAERVSVQTSLREDEKFDVVLGGEQPHYSILVGATETGTIKRGGLGDFIGGYLPALIRHGHQGSLIRPNYARKDLGTIFKKVAVPIGRGSIPVIVRRLPSGEFTVEDEDDKLWHEPYEDADRLRGLVESVALSWLTADLAVSLKSDRVDVNDWPVGLAPVYLKLYFKQQLPVDFHSIFHIHNAGKGYQGVFPAFLRADPKDPLLKYLQARGSIPKNLRTKEDGSVMVMTHPLVGIPERILNDPEHGMAYVSRSPDGRILTPGRFSIFLGGLRFADKRVAVSEKYARELAVPEAEGGQGDELAGAFRHLEEIGDPVLGILNGVDRDPRNDPAIVGPEGQRWGFVPVGPNDKDLIAHKAQNRKALSEVLEFPMAEDDFVVAYVGRLARQKGIDYLITAFRDIALSEPKDGPHIKLIVQAWSEPSDDWAHKTADDLKVLHDEFPDRVYFWPEVQPALSSWIPAGTDIFVQPSRYEPAGAGPSINNMFGTPAILPETGGFWDFIHRWRGVGFLYDPRDPVNGLKDAILKAANLRRFHREKWDEEVARTRFHDTSWDSRMAYYDDHVFSPLSNRPANGASRLVGWLFGTNNPVAIGKIEGFWQSIAGLWALQRASLQGVTNVSDLLHATLPVFLGVVLALLLAHYVTGVVVSEHEQARRWDPMLSLKATGTAMAGFLGWPPMALGLAVGGPVGLIMILAGFAAGPLAHGLANRQTMQIGLAVTPEGISVPMRMDNSRPTEPGGGGLSLLEAKKELKRLQTIYEGHASVWLRSLRTFLAKPDEETRRAFETASKDHQQLALPIAKLLKQYSARDLGIPDHWGFMYRRIAGGELSLEMMGAFSTARADVLDLLSAFGNASTLNQAAASLKDPLPFTYETYIGTLVDWVMIEAASPFWHRELTQKYEVDFSQVEQFLATAGGFCRVPRPGAPSGLNPIVFVAADNSPDHQLVNYAHEISHELIEKVVPGFHIQFAGQGAEDWIMTAIQLMILGKQIGFQRIGEIRSAQLRDPNDMLRIEEKLFKQISEMPPGSSRETATQIERFAGEMAKEISHSLGSKIDMGYYEQSKHYSFGAQLAGLAYRRAVNELHESGRPATDAAIFETAKPYIQELIRGGVHQTLDQAVERVAGRGPITIVEAPELTHVWQSGDIARNRRGQEVIVAAVSPDGESLTVHGESGRESAGRFEFLRRGSAPGAPWATSLSREESLMAFQDSGLEVGIHTVTAGMAYAELKDKPEELAALAEEAIRQGLTPGLDQVEAVKIVRRSRANDKNPIIFLLDNKLDLAGKAAEAGANILDGIGWTPEQVRAIREKYPHIVIISEIAHDSPTVEADFEAAIACGVDGVLLKKYSAWTAKYPEGHPLSIASIRQRHPGMAIVVAGGIFDGKAVTSIRSRLENVLAAVGTNKPQLSEFKAQIQTYSEAAARLRQEGHPPAPVAEKNVSMRVRKKAVVKLHGIDVEVREGGILSLDSTRYPVPTKVDAMADFLKTAAFRPEDGCYFGNQNSSPDDRDASLTRITGLKLYGVDEDPSKVIPGVEAIGRVGPGVRVIGPDATLEGVRRLLALPRAQRPRFMGFDVDDTILSSKKVDVGGGKTKVVKEVLLVDRRELALELARAAREGIRLVFFIDNDSRLTRQRVTDGLATLLSDGSLQAPCRINTYASGMVSKMELVVRAGSDGSEVTYDRDYGAVHRLPAQAVGTIQSILGGVRETDSGQIEATGLVGRYYAEVLTEVVDGKSQLRPEIRAKYPGFLPPLTKHGDVTFPDVQLRDPEDDGTLAQVSVLPVVSAYTPDARIPEDQPDIRRQFFDDYVEAIKQADSQNPAPGASRAVGWLFGTNNPVKIGKIEGFWQSFAGLWALQRAYLQGVTNVSDLLHAALPVFLGVVLALLLAHYISGVVVSEHEQARRWNPMLSLKATGTAMIGFLGWPLMALGLAVGGPVGLIMILAGFSAGPIMHGIANQQPFEIVSAMTPEGMTAPFQMEDAPGPTASGASSRDLKKQAEPLPANELEVVAESMRQQLLARAPDVIKEFLTRTKRPRDISVKVLSAFRQSPPAGFDLSKAGDDQRQTALIRELIGIMQMPGSASVKYKPIDNVLQRYPGVSRPGKGESVHNALKRALSSIALADAFPADVIAIFDEHTGAGRGESLHALVESIVTLGEQLGRPVVLHMDYAETGEVFLSDLNASPELQEVMAKKRYGTIKHNFDKFRALVARLRRERSSSDSPPDREGQSFGSWEFDVLGRHPQLVYFPEMQTYTSWLMTLNSRYLEWKAMKSMDIDDESSLTRQSWTLALDWLGTEMTRFSKKTFLVSRETKNILTRS